MIFSLQLIENKPEPTKPKFSRPMDNKLRVSRIFSMDAYMNEQFNLRYKPKFESTQENKLQNNTPRLKNDHRFLPTKKTVSEPVRPLRDKLEFTSRTVAKENTTFEKFDPRLVPQSKKPEIQHVNRRYLNGPYGKDGKRMIFIMQD